MSAQLTMGPQEYTCGQAVVRDTPRLYNRGHRTPSALSPSDSVVHVATPGVEYEANKITQLSSIRKVIMQGPTSMQNEGVIMNARDIQVLGQKF